MKDYKNALKLIFGGAAIFAFGLLMGSNLDLRNLSSIEGYLYGGTSATPSDATSGNATSGNATSGNATSGNATSENATSGNVTPPRTTVPTTTRSQTNKTIELYNTDSQNYIVNEINNAYSGTTIELNVDYKNEVSSDIFEAIKGQNKTLKIVNNENELIFDGYNVTNPKTINAKITVDSILNNKVIADEISGGVVVSFANNGALPGKAEVRIKNTNLVNDLLENNVYVYYFDKDNDEFVSVAKNVQLRDGYYSFNITHHSDYILTNDEIEDADEDATVDGKTKVSFQKSKTLQFILIAFGIIAVAGAAITLIYLKKNKKTDNKVEEQPSTEEFPWDKK